MIDKTLISMLGYTYTNVANSRFIVVGQVDTNHMRVKLLDQPNFVSGTHPHFGRGYAVFSLRYIAEFKKLPRTDIDIKDIVKTFLSLK